MMNDTISPSPCKGEGRGEGSLPVEERSNIAHQRNLKSLPNAKRLRQDQTDMEHKLWFYLRGRRFQGIKFRRQYPIGRYIVNFICVEKKLIIELDGGQHALASEKDRVRDKWLELYGYKVIRFWNHEIRDNMQGVLERLYAVAGNPHPSPLPCRERELP